MYVLLKGFRNTSDVRDVFLNGIKRTCNFLCIVPFDCRRRITISMVQPFDGVFCVTECFCCMYRFDPTVYGGGGWVGGRVITITDTLKRNPTTSFPCRLARRGAR